MIVYKINKFTAINARLPFIRSIKKSRSVEKSRKKYESWDLPKCHIIRVTGYLKSYSMYHIKVTILFQNAANNNFTHNIETVISISRFITH